MNGIVLKSAFALAVVTAPGIAVLSAVAGSESYAINQHVISAGSSMSATSSCFHMNAVVGEPVAGFSSSTDYTLSTGFLPPGPHAGDDIFFAGFEECTQ
jgi:hypothetical protein